MFPHNGATRTRLSESSHIEGKLGVPPAFPAVLSCPPREGELEGEIVNFVALDTK